MEREKQVHIDSISPSYLELRTTLQTQTRSRWTVVSLEGQFNGVVAPLRQLASRRTDTR